MILAGAGIVGSRETQVPTFTIINNSTGSRTVSSVTSSGITWSLTSGSYPVGAGQNGSALTHPSVTNGMANPVIINFGGSGVFAWDALKNGVTIFGKETGFNSPDVVLGGTTFTITDTLTIILTDN